MKIFVLITNILLFISLINFFALADDSNLKDDPNKYLDVFAIPVTYDISEK